MLIVLFLLHSIIVTAAVILSLAVFKRLFQQNSYRKHFIQKAVLITGCDSGFGQKLAIKCAQSGMTVFASCLTTEGINRLSEMGLKLTSKLYPFQMDVGNTQSVTKGKEYVTHHLELRKQELYAVVNNAGVSGCPVYDDFLSVEDYVQVLNVNTFGAIRVTKAFKELIKQSRGRIVFVSSVLGRVALPGSGPYAVSKFALEAFADTLRLEVTPFNVNVSIIEPGFFRTNITDPERMQKLIIDAWNRAPENIQNQYGTKYFFQYKFFIGQWLDRSSKRIDWVVSMMFDAVVSEHPQLRYNPGYDALFKYIPCTFLPTKLQDIAIKYYGNAVTGQLPPLAFMEHTKVF